MSVIIKDDFFYKDYKHPFGDIYVITRKYKLC